MNNDLISRSELKKAICINEPISIDETWEQLYDAVVKAIDDAPTVEAFPPEKVKELKENMEKKLALVLAEKRPQGEWIEITQRISDSETSTHWECSICREPDRKYGKSKFCCECGAKMKRSE